MFFLRLWPLASQFIRVQVKNGESTMFWSDYWLPMGRLIEIVGDSGPQRLGVGRQAKVADVANESGWQFWRCRNRHLQQIIASIGSVQAPIAGNVKDVTLWRAGPNAYNNKFSSLKPGSSYGCTKRSRAGVRLFGSSRECPISLSSLGSQSEID